MPDQEPPNYLGERIRELLASDQGQLGIQVEVTTETLILRGSVDSEHRRAEVLAAVQSRSGGRRVIDELDAPDRGGAAQVRDPERIIR